MSFLLFQREIIIIWILKKARQTTTNLMDEMGFVGDLSRHEGGANAVHADVNEVDYW